MRRENIAGKLPLQWRLPLNRVLDLLAGLPAQSESRFLEVGEKLQLLADLLRTVETNAAAAGSLMADDTTLLSIRKLGDMVERLEHHFKAADQRAASAGSALAGIFQEMKAICRLLESFKGHVGNLRMLKTLTNIQSACNSRHGAGFRNVALNIGSLSLNIQSKSGAILTRVTHLQAGLEGAMEMVAGLGRVQQRLGREVVATTRQQIAALAGLHEKCAAAARDLSGGSAKITRDVQEIVMAMQFQDITRQQMEHIGEALAFLRSDLENGNRSAAEAAGLCALQSAQLAHSSDELLAAIAKLSASLTAVAGEAAAATAAAHDLFRQAGQAGHAPLAGIETGLQSITASFAENQDTNGRLRDIMGEVAADLGEINGFAADIDYLGSEIRLIALNAIIMAAQAGESGAGFSVIAATVKEQSEEICRQAAAIGDSIHAITCHVAELQAYLENSAAEHRDTVDGSREEELAAIIASLHEVTDSVTGQLSLADEASDRLAVVISQSVAALDNREISRILRGEAIPLLERLVQMLAAVGGSRPSDSSGEMGRMAERYTMESEREIHRLFVPSSPPAGYGTIPAMADGYRDDNVEFF